jgi:hypothetical protein
MDISQFKNLECSGEQLIDFGLQPVSNRFLPPNSSMESPCFSLQINLCPDTGLLHLKRPFPLEEIKPVYNWLTCFEPEDHLDDLVMRLRELPEISKESVFGAYSFKDDTTLQRLSDLGYENTWRIDPEQDLGVKDECANVETYQSVLSIEKAEQIKGRYGAADVLIVRHVIEHAYDLPGFIQFITGLIKPGGYIVWELPDCEHALEVGDCTTIWEEHVFYFTNFTFKRLLYASGFEIVHYESVPYVLENSIVAIVRNAPEGSVIPGAGEEDVALEVNRARNFVSKMAERRLSIRKKLEAARDEGVAISLFGAGHLSVAFISLMEVADLINFVVDDNTHKNGMKMPLGDLNIVGSEALYSGESGICLLGLNPQNQPKVISCHEEYIERGGIFASIFPGSELDIERVV